MTCTRFPIGAILIYVLILNAPTMVAVAKNRATIVQAGFTQGSADEAHYFGLINKMSQGHFGSASLKEYADSLDNVMYGAIPQAALLALTGWNITTIAWIGDFFFPLMAGLLLFYTGRKFFEIFPATLFAILALHVPDIGWLRSVSPQVTLTLFLAFLAFWIWRNNSVKNELSRGLIIALLIFVQIHFAIFALIIEGLEWLKRLWQRNFGKDLLRTFIAINLPVLITVALKIFMTRSAGDTTLTADTLRRLGLIPSYLPANPGLILLLALLFIAAFGTCFRKKEFDILTLVAASVLALSQSILHGKDAIFGLYYAYPILIIVLLCSATMLYAWHRRAASALMSVLAVFAFANVGTSAAKLARMQAMESSEYSQSDIPQVIDALSAMSGSEIVAAPFEIGDILPALTRDYVLFNRFSRFGRASDLELAERYILHHEILQIPRGDEDRTFSLIFGQYAGNMAARKRTLCTILRRFGVEADCNFPVADEIFHQDVRSFVENGRLDPVDAIEKFDVSVIVSKHALPRKLDSRCNQTETIGKYRLFRCH